MANLSQFKILPIGALKPDPRSACAHSSRQVELIAGSIAEFRFANPIIDEAFNIMAVQGCGIELDPAYVDCALRRLHKETGIEPRLAETGETWSALVERRLSDRRAA